MENNKKNSREDINDLRAFLSCGFDMRNQYKGVDALYQCLRHHDNSPTLVADNFSNTFLESQRWDSLVLSDYADAIIDGR